MKNVLSLDSMVAWLETMPPEGRYDFASNYNCLWAQYLKAKGVGCAFVDTSSWLDWPDHQVHPLPEWLNDIGCGSRWSEAGSAYDMADETYGDALDRARKWQRGKGEPLTLLAETVASMKKAILK